MITKKFKTLRSKKYPEEFYVWMRGYGWGTSTKPSLLMEGATMENYRDSMRDVLEHDPMPDDAEMIELTLTFEE
jgi:hypothetical protein